MERLSQELIDEIVDYVRLHEVQRGDWLYPHPWNHLSSCALVCRAFRPRSQMYLFSMVTLPAAGRWLRIGDYSKIPALLNIFNDRPLLVNHVKELNFVLPAGHASWMHYTPEMIPLMDKLNSVENPQRRLNVSTDMTNTSFKIPSTGSHLKLLDFWRKAIAPYFTTIHITRVKDVPAELLAMCTHLRNLVLCDVTLRKPTQPNEDQPRLPLPKIESLEYSVITHNLSDLAPINDDSLFDFSHLHTLTISLNDTAPENLTLAQNIVDASHGALRSLFAQTRNREEINIHSGLSTRFNFEGQPHLHSVTQLAIFKKAGLNTLLDTCLTLKTISTTEFRRLHMIMCVHSGADLPLYDPGWKTFSAEVQRISSDSQGTMSFFLDVHYFAPCSLQWSENGDPPKDSANEILNALIDGPLLLVKQSMQITWEHQVTVDYLRSDPDSEESDYGSEDY